MSSLSAWVVFTVFVGCPHPTTPESASVEGDSPPTEIAGWEGFYPLYQRRYPVLEARQIPVLQKALDRVKGRIGKLIIANGLREAPEMDLKTMEARYCSDPEVKAWNTDRCEALSDRQCESGVCTYYHFGNCSGYLYDNERFFTAAHCVHEAAEDDEIKKRTTVLFGNGMGTPKYRRKLGEITVGKQDFSHHWVVIDDADPVDVAMVILEGASPVGNVEPAFVASLPEIGAPVFVAGFPRVERREEDARAKFGYEPVFGTPSVSFGRLADPNRTDLPLCNVDGMQEHWALKEACETGEVRVDGFDTYRGVITRSPFLSTYDSSNGLSGAPVLDAQGRWIGINVTLISQVDPQEEYRADTKMVAIDVRRAWSRLGFSPEAVDEEPVCNPLSDQELWGRAVLEPGEHGFKEDYRSESFVFYSRPDVSAVNQMNIDTSQAHQEAITKLLGVQPPGPVEIFTYADPDDLVGVHGDRSKLVILRNHRQLHHMSYRHLHELTHIYSYWAGGGHRTIPLVEEGFAEAFGNWTWQPGDPLEKLAVKEANDKHVHLAAKEWLVQGSLPDLEGLLEDHAFRTYQGPLSGFSYFFAASFVLFLIDEYGWEPLRQFFETVCVEDDANQVQEAFMSIYGHPVRELQSQWHAFLDSYDEDRLDEVDKP